MSDLSAAHRQAAALRGEIHDLQRSIRDAEARRAHVAGEMQELENRFQRDRDALTRRQQTVERSVAEQAERITRTDRRAAELRRELREESRRTARELQAIRDEVDRRTAQAERELRALDERLTRQLRELRERQETWFSEVRRAELARGAQAAACCDLAGNLAAENPPADTAALGTGPLEAIVRYGLSAVRTLLDAQEYEAALAIANRCVGDAFHLDRERHRRRHELSARRAAFLRRCARAAAALAAPAAQRFLSAETAALRTRLDAARARVEGGFREHAWFAAEARDTEESLRGIEDLAGRVERLAGECEEWECRRAERLETLLEALAGAFGQAATHCTDWRVSAHDPKSDWMVRFHAPGRTIRLRLPLRGGVLVEETAWSPSHARVEGLLQERYGREAVWRGDSPAAPPAGFHSPLLDALAAPGPARPYPTQP